ncbi:uncharacterized protein [Parasteatoda tepidariorum]|nr:uncharacterized protein LOC107449990 [Parasteatoda tepidariorum]
MTRNLVICLVPTVLTFLAIYWLKRRKKTKSISELPSDSVCEIQEENKSCLESTSSSDIDNTFSDACSFTSPIRSEKSSESDCPLFDSPLHVSDGHPHCNLVLPNCVENSHVSYGSENKDFLRIEDIKNSVEDSEQVFESGIVKFENDSALQQSSKYKNLIKQDIDFFKSEDLFLSEANKDDLSSPNDQTLDLNSSFEIGNNNPEGCLQKNIVECENLDNLTASSPVECEKIIETDCHSSAFDENSLSYVSDDSEGKLFAESTNKDSLSSVLDESSLLSSFCDELDKSSASNSPTAIASNLIKNDGSSSPKDVLNLLSFNESLINIQNYTDSYTESLKESNLGKHLEVPPNEDNNSICPDMNIFGTEKSFSSEVESIIKNLDHSDERSFNPKESDDDLVQNNLSAIKDLSLTSNDKFTCDSKTLNIDAVVAEGSSVSSSTENGHGNGVKSETYASILNMNKNNSSSGAATCILQQISPDLNSLTLNCNDSVNNFSSSNWTDKAVSKSTNLSATSLCSDSKQLLNASNEILPLGRYCEIKTNIDLTVADKNSTSSSHKDSHLELSTEEGYKTVKQCKLECNGFLDPKTSTQSSKEFVYEFELPQELCGRLIGKHGRNVKSIMEHSNANVFIKHHPYDPLLKVVVVEGHRADVNEALEIIRRKYPPSMFPSVTLVQTNVLSSTGVPMPESLQLHLPEGASCDVILSSLVSAGHFFLQQPTHPTYPSLSTLDQCMINLYSQMDTPLLPQPIEAGVICAAPVYRGWYRAQVVYICDNSSDCGIKFVDYGGFSQVPISSLRQIRSDFMSLPFQASECYLAQVRPLGGDTWSSEATSVFEELAQGQILQALLVEYADDGIPCVYLYRVQGVSSTFINKELVERGLAEWVGNNNHWDPH